MGDDTLIVRALRLKAPATGQAIIDAVKKVAGEEFKVSVLHADGQGWHRVGRGSDCPPKDLVIAVQQEGGSIGTHINPQEPRYVSVFVLQEFWPGLKNLIGYGPEVIVQAIEKFRDKLRDELEPTASD